jgi:hypothetical protein
VCGYRTISRPDGSKFQRRWHFGLEAIPILYPHPVLAMKSHVVFSLDGQTISGDAKAQHRARRSQCADWWNDKWRDLTLATTQWLAAGQNEIVLPIRSDSNTSVAVTPITHMADTGYSDFEVREPSAELEHPIVEGAEDDDSESD